MLSRIRNVAFIILLLTSIYAFFVGDGEFLCALGLLSGALAIENEHN